MQNIIKRNIRILYVLLLYVKFDINDDRRRISRRFKRRSRGKDKTVFRSETVKPVRESTAVDVVALLFTCSFYKCTRTRIPAGEVTAQRNLNTMGRSEFLSARQCKLANRTTSECKSRRQLNFSHTIGYFYCRDWRYCDCKHYRNRIISNS